MTTLRSLLAAHPKAFYAQAWYADEKFVDAPAADPLPAKPPASAKFVKAKHGTPKDWQALPTAATLAALYVRFPDAPCWRGYLWCRDRDAKGQQVYVGAVLGKGLEIHRHLALNGLWGVPTWT